MRRHREGCRGCPPSRHTKSMVNNTGKKDALRVRPAALRQPSLDGPCRTLSVVPPLQLVQLPRGAHMIGVSRRVLPMAEGRSGLLGLAGTRTLQLGSPVPMRHAAEQNGPVSVDAVRGGLQPCTWLSSSWQETADTPGVQR